MPNVVRFTLSTARTLDVPGAGAFHLGVLDVDANDSRLLARTRYKVQAYGAIEVGVVDAATPFPLLPAAPVEPTPDPYPQYLTEVEVGEEYVRWDQIDPAEPIIGVVDGDLAAIGNKTVRRDAAGYAAFMDVGAVNQPTQPYHTTRKDYVDNIGSADPVAGVIARRSVDGGLKSAWSEFGTTYITDAAPTTAAEATRKDYVDGKTRKVINAEISSRTLVLSDEGKWIYGNSPMTFTIPPDSTTNFPQGAIIEFGDIAGKVTIAPGSGVILLSPGGLLSTRTDRSTIRLLKLNANVWILSGDVG